MILQARDTSAQPRGPRIGAIDIPGRVSLAPLAGVTDLPFRLLCKEYGASMMTTEMVSAEGLVRRHQATLDYMRFDERERPIAVQIWGGEPATMAEAARIVVDEVGPEFVDVNFGCPVKKVVGKGAGSACLREPERVGDILAAMVAAVDVPVTAKIRAGWDVPIAADVARIVEDAGAGALSIHGRTRGQGYSGEADWNLVRDAVRATTRLCIIGNGDVGSAPVARRRFEETGCQMIMIGRGAMGQPWIFSQIEHYFATGDELAAPAPADRVGVAMRHYRAAVEIKGADCAVREMRSHLSYYLKDLAQFPAVRPRLMKSADPGTVLDTLASLEEQLRDSRGAASGLA